MDLALARFFQIKVSHNRHHNVKIITFSTGITEMVVDLNITTVEIILRTRNDLPATCDLFAVIDRCWNLTAAILTDFT